MNKPETKRRIPDMEIFHGDNLSLDDYQVVRGEFFSHTFEPSITFDRNKFSVNTACIKKLPDVDYVQSLVNVEKKKLIIRPCKEEEKDSFCWRSNGKKRVPKKVTCKIFFGKIYSLMGWDLDYKYKLLGKLVYANGSYLFYFDLNTPEIYERKKNDDGKPEIIQKPLYLEEWQDHFGISVKEHKEQLNINIIDGYTIFDVSSKKKNDKMSGTDYKEKGD